MWTRSTILGGGWTATVDSQACGLVSPGSRSSRRDTFIITFALIGPRGVDALGVRDTHIGIFCTLINIACFLSVVLEFRFSRFWPESIQTMAVVAPQCVQTLSIGATDLVRASFTLINIVT